MPIQDLAGNPLIDQSSPMLGYTPVVLNTDEDLSLEIYRFLIEVIREEDQNNGNQFVERFLNGPQEVWDTIDKRIKAIPSLWSVTDIEDRFLIYLKWIVGWTSELDYITDDLDSATLRRLIASSVAFWKERGTEDAMLDILRLTTAARLRIWNWFDIRWIAGETQVGEDAKGYDSWMLSLPGPPNYDENRMNVRIVDDGSLNRRLVRNLVRLTRPDGERITITYIGFLDMFLVDDDDSQWSHNGAGATIVDGGTMALSGTEDAVVNLDGADDWTNYTFSARVKGNGQVQFYRTADTDYYYVEIDIAANTLELGKLLAGAPTVLSTVDMEATFGEFLDADLFYMIRILVTPEAATSRIVLFWDSNLATQVTDTDHTEGAIGLASTTGALECDEVEMFFNPADEDTIDINS